MRVKVKIVLISIYIFLYITHVILGPYYYRMLLKGDKPYYADNIDIIVKRMVYITYVSMLYTIYFFINPTTENYICGLLMTSLSLVLYVIKRDTSDKHYYESIIDHSLLLLPYFFYKFYFNIRLGTYKISITTYITAIIIILYGFLENIIYL